MAEVEIRSVYECDVHTFWENFYLTEDYGRVVYLDGLGFRRWELLRCEDDGQRLTREVVLEKPLSESIPRVLRKLAGDSLVFTERGVFDRDKAEYAFTLVADRFKKNGTVHGLVRTEPHPEGCLRIVRLQVNVQMLGMGKLVEGTLLEAFASGYRDGVQYGNEWLRKRPQSAATRRAQAEREHSRL